MLNYFFLILLFTSSYTLSITMKADPNCSNATKDTCNSCKDGFYLKTNKCIKCSIDGCIKCTETNCTQCLPGKLLQNNKCIEDNKCKTLDQNCTTCSGNKCLECLQSWKPSGDNRKCVPNSNEPNCAKAGYENGQWKCIGCEEGYTISNYKCTKTKAENCIVYDNTGIDCYMCKGDYYFKNKKCYKCPDGCMTCWETGCSKCLPGKTLNNNICK